MWLLARGLVCFPAQFTANDRAPAGRNMIEPFGLHMCGWAKDNRRCSWNSQTGYKIASRMQRKRKEPSVLHNEPPASRPAGLLERPGGSGLLSPGVLGISEPACVSTGPELCSSSPLISGFGSVSMQDPRLPTGCGGIAGSQGGSVLLHPDVPLCLGLEKSGNGPERTREPPPSSLPCSHPLWKGTLGGSRGEAQRGGCAAASLEGGGWHEQGMLGSPECVQGGGLLWGIACGQSLLLGIPG